MAIVPEMLRERPGQAPLHADDHGLEVAAVLLAHELDVCRWELHAEALLDLRKGIVIERRIWHGELAHHLRELLVHVQASGRSGRRDPDEP